MDVRCPQCGTDYVFDERRIGPRGVSVKCTACSHVFRVYRPEADGPPWLIRHPDGAQVQFRDLTVLQKWIVEGRIDRRSEISRSGERWRLLGEIAELEPFFKVYEEAEELRRLRGGQSQPAPAVPSTDVVRAMDPIDPSAFDSEDIPIVTVDDSSPTQRTLSARPTTQSQRRHQRSTDLVVGPAPGFESSDERTGFDSETDTDRMEAPDRAPTAVFASETLDFSEEPAPASRAEKRARPRVGLLLLLVLVLALAGIVGFGVLFPEQARPWLDRIGLEDIGPLGAKIAPSVPTRSPERGDDSADPSEETGGTAEANPGAEADPTGGAELADAAAAPDETAGESVLDASTARDAGPATAGGAPAAPATPTDRDLADLEASAVEDSPGAAAPTSRPPSLEGILARGRALLEADRADDALDAFGRAADLDPASAAAHVGKGHAYLALDRPRLALAAFEQARAADAELTETYFGLGEAQLRLGQRRAARSAFRTYLDRAPETATHRETARVRLRSLR